MRSYLERHQDALGDFARARALAAEAGDVALEAELALDEATALDWTEEYASSRARVERALELAAALAPVPPHLAARLLLAEGRSLHRFSEEEAAARTLERAVDAAERLGDAAYETRIIALVLLGFIYPAIGRLDEARRALDRAVRSCEEHGDLLHLVAALNNRALLLAYQGDKAGMLADFARQLELARVLGHRTPELFGHYNLGEYLYLMDDLEAAEPHVRRAIALEERRAGDAARPVVALLGARLALYRGDEASARGALDRIRAHQISAGAEGRTDMLMVPSEEVLADMIDLATRDAGAAAWDDLEARSERSSVGQERIEVIEARAIAAERRGRLDEAAAALERALAIAARVPNVMESRLRRRLAAVQRSLGRA